MAAHVHGPTGGKKLWVSLIMTLCFVAGEAYAGWVSHSLSLISDAGHNLSDAVALGLAAFAVWIAKRPPSPRHTYGFHRAAILTALFNAATLVVIAVFIGVEAYQRFLHPEPVGGTLMIGVALVAVVMNTIIALSLREEATHSLNSRAAYVHMAGDAVSSLAVVVAGIVIRYTGWIYADPLASALIAAFILHSAVDIVKDATTILMEATPDGIDVEKLLASLRAIPPVMGVHDLHLWTVGDGMNCLSCHVALPRTCSLEDCAGVIATINQRLHDEFGIGHATIQTEIDGLCVSDERYTPYCAMEPHTHHDEH